MWKINKLWTTARSRVFRIKVHRVKMVVLGCSSGQPGGYKALNSVHIKMAKRGYQCTCLMSSLKDREAEAGGYEF